MFLGFSAGLINESVPLAALIAPALSRDSIKFLTRDTVYSKRNTINEEEEIEDNVVVPDKLTGPLLAKVAKLISFCIYKRCVIFKNDKLLYASLCTFFFRYDKT